MLHLLSELEQKPSRLGWLGCFPRRWRVAPGFAVLRERQVKNIGMRESRVLSLSYGRVIVKPEEKLRGLVPESFETYQIVEPGHIIIRPTDLQNDHVSLRVGRVRDRGIITSAYLCLEARGELMPDYAHLLLLSYDLRKVFYGLGSGLRQNLSWVDFKRLPIPVPTRHEQEQIVRFVRHLDSKVNRLIKAKRQLIELLNEQKQAIIHQAVTRGLDPTVPLKPSGIEWLGNIPANFQRTRLARLCTSIRDGTHNPPPAVEGVHRLLSVRNIVNGEFVERPDDRTMTPEAFAELQRSYDVREGDLMLALVGGTTGKAALAKPMANVSVQRSLGIIRSRSSKLLPEYLLLVVRSDVVQSQIRRIKDKYAAQPGIYLTDVGNLIITFPSAALQSQIVEWVAGETSSLDDASRVAQSEIDLIREYRTRLVADVVTGQLDVRHLDLPDVEEVLVEPAFAEIEEDQDEDQVLEPELAEA